MIDFRDSHKAEEAYVACKGTHCPSCGSDDLLGAEVTIDCGEATQDIICNECGAEWTDVYKLTGYL